MLELLVELHTYFIRDIESSIEFQGNFLVHTA